MELIPSQCLLFTFESDQLIMSSSVVHTHGEYVSDLSPRKREIIMQEKKRVLDFVNSGFHLDTILFSIAV